MSLERIAENKDYSVGVDAERKIVYLAVKGFWSEEETARDYVATLRAAVKKVSSPFAVVADLTEMVTPSPVIGKYHEQIQQELVADGLCHTAEIWPTGAVLKMALQRYAKMSGNPVSGFSAEEAGKEAAIAQAKQWLAEQGYE